MTEFELFQRFGVAIAIGALVGAERHWRERAEEDGRRTAGLRTFTLIGLFGAVAGALELALRGAEAGLRPGGLVLIGLFLPFSAGFILFHYREQLAEQDFSVTSVVAAMVTYALGALAVLGDIGVAGAAGVVLAGVLAARERLHGFMRALTFAELRSAIILLAMSVVILPLVPNEPIGPFGGIAPARIWTLAILVAAISFAGYVAVKVIGEAHGELVAGTVGGLLSSTAVTVTNARRSVTAEAQETRGLVAGALGAGLVSYLRTAALVIGLAPGLAASLVPPLAVAGVTVALAAWLMSRGTGSHHAVQDSRNPFYLSKVIQMALLLAALGSWRFGLAFAGWSAAAAGAGAITWLVLKGLS